METLRIPIDTVEKMSREFKNSARTQLDFLTKDSKKNFDQANVAMAYVVTAPSVFQLCTDIGKTGSELEIDYIFRNFLITLGSKFKDHKNGTDEYNLAVTSVGELVKEYTPKVLNKFGVEINLDDVISKVDKTVLASVLAPEFNLGDSKFPNPLSNDEEICLKTAFALAQAGYVHSQLFRSIEEDPARGVKPKRFDKPVFDINQSMKQRVFNEAYGSDLEKFEKVVDEVYKDIEQFK